MSTAGQRLSIISRSGIRYEGTLNKIDPTENTVSLTNVKMLGTETRPVAEYIPPKDDVYDFIIFKGSDIKDLTVFESKTQPPPDPAIVSAGKAVPQKSTAPSGSTSRNVISGGVGNLSSFNIGKPSYNQSAAAADYESYATSKPAPASNTWSGNKYNNPPAREPPAYSGGKGSYKGHKDHAPAPSHQGYGGYGGVQRSGKGEYSGGAGKGGKSSYSGGGYGGGNFNSYSSAPAGKGSKGGKDSYKGGKGKGKGKGKGNAYASHTGMEFAPQDKAGTQFKEDFDFEAMQKEIKAEEKEHKQKLDKPAGGQAHYKKDNSFFDTLTYDANNREKVEKVEKQAQHETDCQTFGTKTVEDYERKTQGHYKGGKKGGKGGKSSFKGSKGSKGSKGGKSSYKGKY